MNAKYDIFISYRREGGAQYARILQLMLTQRGYRVFLDYDELVDGIFKDNIKAAIKEAPIFILILSKGAMLRCANDKDWVRQELTLAVEYKKHIIPVNPDFSFDGVPDEMPKDLKEAICSNQHSEISFGQSLSTMIDILTEKRLVPTLGKRDTNEYKDKDTATVQKGNHKQNTRNSFIKKTYTICSIIITIVSLFLYIWHQQKNNTTLQALQEETRQSLSTQLQKKHSNFHLILNTDLTSEQLETIDAILSNVSEVYPDSIWISQFEFTKGQWYSIRDENYNKEEKNMPITNISYADIVMFLVELGNMTNLNFELPSADVWEYSARGGYHNENTLYSGDNIINNVAWYKENSSGHEHPSDGQQGKSPNMLDLYDMSGNIGEICNTPFNNTGLYTVCGGDYNSSAEEVTIFSRRGIATDARSNTTGFRLIIRKP